MAAIVAERILLAFDQPLEIRGHELNLMVCVGIAIYPSDARDADSLLTCAEQAVLTAKKNGRHGYQFFQKSMMEESQRELSLYNGIARDEVFRELKVLFQPIINVKTGTIHCMDSLLYWDSPKNGLIPPHELLDLVDKHRKLNLFSEWQLRHACEQFLHWRKMGFTPSYLGIAVSVKQLESSQFVYRISQVIRELAFDPAWLLIEIRENGQPISFDVLEKAFNMLKYLGVQMAIDHFGKGSFSVVQLAHYPIQYVKIDETLLADVGTNQRTVIMLKALLSMTQLLSVQMVIQGVESEEQLAILKEIGCELIQGRLLSAPLTETEIESKMATLAGTNS